MAQSSGMPDAKTFQAASFRLIAAGWRRDPDLTAAVIAELTSTPRPANVVARQVRTIRVLSQLIAALVTTVGELLRSEDPTAALTQALAFADRDGA